MSEEEDKNLALDFPIGESISNMNDGVETSIKKKPKKSKKHAKEVMKDISDLELGLVKEVSSLEHDDPFVGNDNPLVVNDEWKKRYNTKNFNWGLLATLYMMMMPFLFGVLYVMSNDLLTASIFSSSALLGGVAFWNTYIRNVVLSDF